MILAINQIKLPLDHKEEDLYTYAIKALKCKKEDIESMIISKKSIDARRKDSIKVIYNIKLVMKKNINIEGLKNKNIIISHNNHYKAPYCNHVLNDAPVVIGSGPAGLFCALILAEAGLKPIVLERGEAVDVRMKDVSDFFDHQSLKLNSNIQFGEGGAGTFSDGKLNTGVKDKWHRKEKILETFILAGAPEEIAYINKPHIGTDYLVEIVKNIREKIKDLGGSVLFNKTVTDFIMTNQKIEGVIVNKEEKIYSNNVVLAIGHSARDTFKMLKNRHIKMEQKAFAIGLRIEHPQQLISKNQYGKDYQHHNLPVADYKLTYRSKSGRGVYSFCMCPGGYVVNASSEENQVVCNGMSNFKRDAVNANSAILVNVTPDDFGSNDLLAGVEFQRKWERLAYENAGSDYSLPIQLFGDYLNGKISQSYQSIAPSTKGKTAFSDLNHCLPLYVNEAIKEGVLSFDRKIKGFSNKEALLTGVETRSSSPVRMVRDERFESNITGLYPCGEGAGYAGGIMSAAIDGIKVAEAIIQK